ncbi:MAG TPA: hypothetical protein VK855_08940 [Thioalkalivibrio sp.]|jgi:hypothetical protein|nr:hypothetical protein [Thioalkalivibrio sp.]
MYRRIAGALLVAMFIVACASAPVGRKDLLIFLQDGQTSRQEVYLALGEPSAVFESGRILAYRLGQDEGGYYLLQQGPGFQGVNYSLVLVFDDTGQLARHALVEVRRP